MDTEWRKEEAERRKREQKEREVLLKKIGEYTVDEVLKLHETVIKQNALLERLCKAGAEYTRIVDFDGDKPVTAAGAKVEKPEFPVKIGDWVIASRETKQITETSQRAYDGEVVTVSRVIDDRRAEVGSITGARFVLRQPGINIEPGDEWLASGNILLHPVSRPLKQEAQNDYSPVHWDEIGGLHVVKQELRESIALLRGGDKFSKAYGVTQPKGVLLSGPPGNGKTMLGRAVATDLAKGGDLQFLYVKGPEILSKYVGSSEEKIRSLFLRARGAFNKTGYPAVIFIDECDAVMNARGSGRSSDVERTIVPAFLTEMDGLEHSHVFLMLATNRKDTLDPAIIREGRIDRHIFVGSPDYDAAKHIFTVLLKKTVIAGQIAELAKHAADLVSDNHELSGAHCAAIIERAKRIAMRRDMGKSKPSGVSMADLEMAVRE
jgi:ATP-dependent 26S proteasome regulatory subunit